MDSAYDLKLLVLKLKGEGLDLAEDGAKKVFLAVIAFIKEGAAKSPSAIDDMVASLLPPVEAYVLSQIDKIDGQVG